MTAEQLGVLGEELARAMEPECWRMVDIGHECDGVKARVVASISHAASVIMVLKEKGIV